MSFVAEGKSEKACAGGMLRLQRGGPETSRSNGDAQTEGSPEQRLVEPTPCAPRESSATVFIGHVE
jgi:hypothetical protein